MKAAIRLPALALMLGLGASVLTGCTGAVVGGAAMTGVAAYQERGIGGVTHDTQIEAAIVEQWFRFDHTLPAKVSAEVYNGRVLLTGAVTSAQTAADAVRLAWKADGVQDVINEIQEVADTSLIDGARDTLISTKLRTALTFDADIYAINYSIETVNGIVYLIGIAQDQAELDRVIAYAEGQDYVRKVVSHVMLKAAAGAEEAAK
jgi:osmotically-inducible protein OsmY